MLIITLTQIHRPIGYGFETFERNFIKYNMINYGNSAYPVKTITGYVNTDKIDEILASSCKYYKPKFREMKNHSLTR